MGGGGGGGTFFCCRPTMHVILAIPAAALGDMVLELAEMAAAMAACRSASSRTDDEEDEEVVVDGEDGAVDVEVDFFVGELFSSVIPSFSMGEAATPVVSDLFSTPSPDAAIVDDELE